MAADDVLSCLHPEINQRRFPAGLVFTALPRLSNPPRRHVNGNEENGPLFDPAEQFSLTQRLISATIAGSYSRNYK
jgi:hypothetical protein